MVAQLRYGTMVIRGKGVEKNIDEAVNYILKAAKNGNVIAMFNIATYYLSQDKEEHKKLGKYYMIEAANKKYEEAIKYCKVNNISY